MTPFPPSQADTFPYTLDYVTRLLAIDEATLRQFVRVLALSPRYDDTTGRPVFNEREMELLRRAVSLHQQGESVEHIGRYFGVQPQATAYSTVAPATQPTPTTPTAPIYHQGKQWSGSTDTLMKRPPEAPATGKLNDEQLAGVVNAMTQVKSHILDDMSRLLDDKLIGLDEVVVELIRCKTENEKIKTQLEQQLEEKERLQFELSRFKPSGFGFYRKL